MSRPSSDAVEEGAGPVPRVLLVLASSGWGGTEKAVVELANALARRTQVALAIPDDAVYTQRVADAVTVHALRAGSRRNPFTLRHLRRLVRDVDPDVVHSHAARATEMVHWVARTTPLRHVATKHNTRPRWVFSRVPWVTAVSRSAAASIRHPRGVTVVYDAVDVVCPKEVAKEATFTLLGVGRLHRHKGFDRLVDAVGALPFPCRLRIAGEGPERGALQERIRALDLEDRVELLGHREDVPDLMASAHLQVVPSRTEGFNLALVEGLLCCDAVLSTPVGIAPEILPEALLAPHDALAERIRAVHADYARFVETTSRARAEVGDRFHPERVLRQYLEVYRRAMAG